MIDTAHANKLQSGTLSVTVALQTRKMQRFWQQPTARRTRLPIITIVPNRPGLLNLCECALCY
ncbi:hypothetical protein O6474_24140, partial [Salmonella enterica subsp. enterica]